MSSAEEPLYNIGAVSRMTGIAEGTLRAWERRYRFPQPTRSLGQQRLYSPQEVQRIQWVKARIAEGMQPSRAIHALVQGGAENATSLAPSRARKSRPMRELTLAGFQQRLLESLKRYDSATATQLMRDALEHYPLDTLAIEVVGPLLNTIGEQWSVGAMDVAMEHFASEWLRGWLRAWMRPTEPVATIGPVGLACAPGELHEGSLLILGVLLTQQHWPVLYLGQTFPVADLPQLIEHAHPSALVFVAMTEPPARELATWPRYMPADANTAPLLCFGGGAFNEHRELAEEVPGIFIGTTLHEGAATLNRLLLELQQGE